MKNLLLVPVIAVLLLLAGCPKPIDPSERLISATISVGIDEIVIPFSNGRTSVQVPGFEQKFDTVTVLLNNTTTNKSYMFYSVGSKTIDILVPAGTYDIFMESDNPSPFIPLTDYIPFTAEGYAVSITNGSNIVLDPTLNRALVLFVKTGLDGPPSIVDYDITSEPPNQYPEINMISDTEFYYIYPYGTWRFRITYTQNGVTSFFDRTFLAGKIYVYDINGGVISTTDLFDEVITNN